MATKSATATPLSAFGEMTRFAELRQRLFFLLGALIVYRIGTFIPVPGIDPVALARFFEAQQGTILSMVNMFSGGAHRASVDLRIGSHALHFGVDHHPDDGCGHAVAGSDQEGRRVGPAQAYAVHALWHGAAGCRTGRFCSHRAAEPGRRHRIRVRNLSSLRPSR